MKKKIGLFMVLAMLVGALAGCTAAPTKEVETDTKTEESAKTDADKTEEGSTDKIRIGLTLMDYNFPFFQDMLAMAKYTAEQQGVELIDIDGAGDVQKQLQSVEDLIAASNVDGLFLNPVDSEAISPATLQANEEGIPVVTVDVRSSQGDVIAHVASNNIEIGREAGKYAVEMLKERNGSEKGVVFVMGFSQITSIRDRADGFTEILSAFPDIQIVQKDPIGLNVQDALEVWEDQMQTFPEGKIDIVYGANCSNATGILSATESAGRTDFAIIGVDDDPILNAALENPNSPYAASVVQSPTEMGKIGIELCVKAAKGESIDEKEVATPVKLVTKETYAEFKKEVEKIQAMIADYK